MGKHSDTQTPGVRRSSTEEPYPIPPHIRRLVETASEGSHAVTSSPTLLEGVQSFILRLARDYYPNSGGEPANVVLQGDTSGSGTAATAALPDLPLPGAYLSNAHFGNADGQEILSAHLGAVFSSSDSAPQNGSTQSFMGVQPIPPGDICDPNPLAQGSSSRPRMARPRSSCSTSPSPSMRQTSLRPQSPYPDLQTPPFAEDSWDPPGPDSEIWNMYLEDATKFDTALIDDWNRIIDVLLLFAALFSAVLSAFVIEAYKGLKPDSADQAVSLLQQLNENLVALRQGTTASDVSPAASMAFSPSSSVVRVNCAWFASLTLSLGVTGVAVLAKQWLNNYDYSNVSGSTRERARLRQYRYTGLQKWKVPEIIALLPLLLLASLALFYWGLIEFLWALNSVVAFVMVVLVGCIGLFFAFTTLSPLLSPRCPYRTSLSYVFRLVATWSQHQWRMGQLYFAYLKQSISMSHTEPENTWERQEALREAFDEDLFFSLSGFTVRQEEQKDLESFVEAIDTRALAWLITSSPDDRHVQAAIRACSGIATSNENASILREAGLSYIIQQRLLFLFRDANGSLSPNDASIAGACARIHCMLGERTGTPCHAVLKALTNPDPEGGSEILSSLVMHSDGNIACYANRLVHQTALMSLSQHQPTEMVSMLVQYITWNLECILLRHLQGINTLGTRPLVVLLNTLNELAGKASMRNKYTNQASVREMAALLAITPGIPDELRRAIIVMLRLHFETPMCKRLASPEDAPSTSLLTIPLLRCDLPEDIMVSVLASIPGNRSTIGHWVRDGIIPVLLRLLEHSKQEETISDRMLSAIAGVVGRLGRALPCLHKLRHANVDVSLVQALSLARSTYTWTEACRCLTRISGEATRSYDTSLGDLCVARLKGATSGDETSAITSLLAKRVSLQRALMEDRALGVLAQLIRKAQGKLLFDVFIPIASAVIGEHLDGASSTRNAEIIFTSGLLSAISQRLQQYDVSANPPQVFAWLRHWARIGGKLYSLDEYKQGVIESGLMSELERAWTKGNHIMEWLGAQSLPAPWEGETDEDRLLSAGKIQPVEGP